MRMTVGTIVTLNVDMLGNKKGAIGVGFNDYGDGCQFSDSVLSHVFRLKESDTMNKRRKSSIVLQQSQNADVPASSKTYSKEEAMEVGQKVAAKVYRQQLKNQ